MTASQTAPRQAASPPTSEGWRVVDAALDELERLAAENVAEEAFYAALFERLTGLGFAGAAVWRMADAGEPRLERHSIGGEQDKEESLARSQAAPVQAVLETGQARLVTPAGKTEANGGAAGGRSIVAPWQAAEAARGGLQVWLAEGTSAAAHEGFLRLAATISEVVGSYRARHEQQALRQQVSQHAKLDVFGQSLHESLELAEVAARIANDGRVVAGCDRLAVAIRRGNQYKILAVSGAEHIHRRAETVQQLQQLCAAVAATGQSLWQESAPQELPPQIDEALNAYLEQSPALALAAIPLAAPKGDSSSDSRPIGMLVAEQYKQPFEPASRALVEGLVPHARLALANALRMESIPGHRLWLALGREGRLPRWAARALVAAVVLAAIIGTLVAIPAELQVKTRGELVPAVRHEVFAPRDGVVTAVHVDHGQQVKAGDKLLELRSPELDLELQAVQGELETTRKQLAATQSERLQIRPGETDARLKERRLTAEEEQYQQQVRGLEQRQTLLQKEREALTVRSTVAGEVVTWNAQERLASRPLRRGDALLTIADTSGPWELELSVPSRLAGRVLAARRGESGPQSVSYMLTTEPGVTLHGTVKHVAERVEINEAGESYLRVTVDVPPDVASKRVPGATTVARIGCGRTNLAGAWFYELWDAARLWLPF